MNERAQDSAGRQLLALAVEGRTFAECVEEITERCRELGCEDPRMSVAQLGHILNCRRKPSLLYACAFQLWADIEPATWLIPPVEET